MKTKLIKKVKVIMHSIYYTLLSGEKCYITSETMRKIIIYMATYGIEKGSKKYVNEELITELDEDFIFNY